MWTKTSWPPPSGWMKPKPLVGLNHLTVPVAIMRLRKRAFQADAPTGSSVSPSGQARSGERAIRGCGGRAKSGLRTKFSPAKRDRSTAKRFARKAKMVTPSGAQAPRGSVQVQVVAVRGIVVGGQDGREDPAGPVAHALEEAPAVLSGRALAGPVAGDGDG